MADKPFRIFVVEDNEWYSKLLVHTLSLNPDYEIRSFRNAAEFLSALNESPDVVTLDYRLPDLSGLEVLKRIKDANSEIQVILVSEQADTDMVVNGIYLGILVITENIYH